VTPGIHPPRRSLQDHTVFWVNRATARAVALDLPPDVLIRATTLVE
jgi:hypothetical protein